LKKIFILLFGLMILTGGTCLAAHASDLATYNNWIVVSAPDSTGFNSSFAAATHIDEVGRVATFVQYQSKDNGKIILKLYLNSDCSKYFLVDKAMFDEKNSILSNKQDMANYWVDVVPGSAEEKLFRTAFKYAHEKSAQ